MSNLPFLTALKISTKDLNSRSLDRLASPFSWSVSTTNALFMPYLAVYQLFHVFKTSNILLNRIQIVEILRKPLHFWFTLAEELYAIYKTRESKFWCAGKYHLPYIIFLPKFQGATRPNSSSSCWCLRPSIVQLKKLVKKNVSPKKSGLYLFKNWLNLFLFFVCYWCVKYDELHICI
jgi:hypothetical protein